MGVDKIISTTPATQINADYLKFYMKMNANKAYVDYKNL